MNKLWGLYFTLRFFDLFLDHFDFQVSDLKSLRPQKGRWNSRLMILYNCFDSLSVLITLFLSVCCLFYSSESLTFRSLVVLLYFSSTYVPSLCLFFHSSTSFTDLSFSFYFWFFCFLPLFYFLFNVNFYLSVFVFLFLTT